MMLNGVVLHQPVVPAGASAVHQPVSAPGISRPPAGYTVTATGEPMKQSSDAPVATTAAGPSGSGTKHVTGSAAAAQPNGCCDTPAAHGDLGCGAGGSGDGGSTSGSVTDETVCRFRFKNFVLMLMLMLMCECFNVQLAINSLTVL